MLHQTITGPGASHITYYPDLHQGSDEWLAARRGIMTASEMNLVLTPTLKTAKNKDTRAHAYELAAQRISGFVEPRYISDDMLRGHDDEIYARMAYAEHFSPVDDMGFIVTSGLGFPIGYSPDGLVGDDGLIECKSRAQKYQVQTVVEHVATGCASIPADYILQHQTGLIVSERKWIDFISYCGGLPMVVIRVWPDDAVQAAIKEAAQEFEHEIRRIEDTYHAAINSMPKVIETERRIIQEMF